MRRSARDSEPKQELTTREHILREPLPSARAILWKPLPDSYHLLASMMRTAEQQACLFVTQRAFLQVERHLRSAPDLELGGFLAGQLYECPRAHVRYSVVNTVVPFADVSGDPIGSRVTEEAFQSVRKRLDAHRLSLIGWYRNGNGLGLQLLPDDVETHLTYFDQPWQTTMLVVPDPAKSKGAFFTYDPRVGRSYCIPFYELFDTHSVDANRLDRTCVSWTTYVAAAPVEPLTVPDKEIVETRVAPIRRSAPEPEPPEPIDEWWDAIKDPWVRLKDVAASATRRDDPSLVVSQPSSALGPLVGPRVGKPARAPVPLPPVQERRVPDERVRVPDERVVLPPPAAILPRPDRAQAQPARPAPVQREVQRPAPARPAPPRKAPRPRSAPPSADETPASAAPAVALAPNFYEEAIRWRRRRRLGFAVAGVSFLGVILLSTLRSRSSRDAQAAMPAVVRAEPAEELVVASNGNGHSEISLTSTVDSLSGALAYYRDIADDHRQGLVGCRVLDRAYTLVGRARTRVDSTRRHVAGDLSDADSIRVSMLGAEYTHVADTYRRSGCNS